MKRLLNRLKKKEQKNYITKENLSDIFCLDLNPNNKEDAKILENTSDKDLALLNSHFNTCLHRGFGKEPHDYLEVLCVSKNLYRFVEEYMNENSYEDVIFDFIDASLNQTNESAYDIILKDLMPSDAVYTDIKVLDSGMIMIFRGLSNIKGSDELPCFLKN